MNRTIKTRISNAAGQRGTSRLHFVEYLIEAAGLAVFMFSACSFGTLLQHPASPLYQALPSESLRRLLMGIAMGTTAVLIIYSPWGRRSGAHINPSITLSYLRLARTKPIDAAGYVAFQLLGGIAGVALAHIVFGPLVAHPGVNFVATVPGEFAGLWAFPAEVLISFAMMTTVLVTSSLERTKHWTGAIAGSLVCLYILIEAPISGMSMNPARTLASAVFSHSWSYIWIYFTAPPLGMLAAAEFHYRLTGRKDAACAKLQHDAERPCIFCGASGTTGSRAQTITIAA